MIVNQEEYDVSKALDSIEGSPYHLEEITEGFTRQPVKPGLLRTLFDPQDESMTTDTYKFDETVRTVQLPSGKPYSGYGPDLQKDKPKRHRFEIPSFGLRFNVRPEDYSGRRKPGTANEFLTEADVIAEMNVKIQTAWDLLDELGIATLLTTDQNIIQGGPFTQHNFFTEIVGTDRATYQGAAKIDMDLDNGSPSTPFEVTFRTQRKLTEQELARAGDSSGRMVVICGDTFFNQRYEIQKNEGLGRAIEFGPDLASQPINQLRAAGFAYDAFDGFDGLTYVNYGSSIITGTKLIGDGDAYLVPFGASMLMKIALAPAQTRSYVNTAALPMYAWTTTTERQGVTVWTERNMLFSLLNARAIRHLVNT